MLAIQSVKPPPWLLWMLRAALLLFAAGLALQPLGETDLFFHLKLGDLILAERAIPFRNLFSFTYPAHPDLDLSWAFQVLVSLLYRVGGFPAIVVFKAVCVCLAAMLVHHASRRLGAGPAASALATVLALFAAAPRVVERPHLITFVGLGLLSCLLVEVQRGRRWLLWLVPPLAALWANFHAGVFLCVVVLALDRVTARIAGDRTVGWGELLGVIALTAVATLLTPAGRMLPSYLIWHTGLGSTRIIEEFRVADPYNDPWFFGLLGLCACGALSLGRTHLHRVGPVLCLAALAWRSVRFVAEWALVAAPLMALTLDRIASRLAPLLSERAGTAVLSGLLLLGALRECNQHPLRLADDLVPFSAIRFVTEHRLRERLYHDLDVGCYLLWDGWPRYRVFQDARLPAYPDDFHRALDSTPLDPAAFGRFLDQYGVDAALINYPGINMRAGSFDPEKWALVYRDEDAMVFARRVPRHAEVIARYEIPLRIRFRFLGGTSVEALSQPPEGCPVPQCEWDRRLVAAWEAEDRPDRALAARLAAVDHGCLKLAEVPRDY